MQFRVTLVQNFQTFWVDARSERVRVSLSGHEPPLPESAVTSPPTAAPTEQTSGQQDMTDILVGVSTGCECGEVLGILICWGGEGM